MTVAAVGTNSQALWYTTRGFGMVSLVLLTLTTVLGLAQAARYARPGLPRFVVSALHKNGSLLALAVIGVHVATAVLDTFAPIRVIDLFVPYASRYRPFWTGMGALALDLMLAVIVTSLLRERIGHQVWRTVHWAAYASWPVAVIHGLGTGSDTKLGWILFIYFACTAAVLAALWWRLAREWTPRNAGWRGSAVAVSVVVPVAIAAWAATGPLRPGWARKAGTPSALLASGSRPSATGGSSAATTPSSAAPAAALTLPLQASLSGTHHSTGPDSSGLVSVVIDATFQPQGSGPSGAMKLVLTGQPSDGGGVSLTGSQVSLGPAADPSEYHGQVSRLEGDTVVASLQDGRGRAATAVIRLSLGNGSDQVRGSLQVTA